jgi:hypothetical protein
MFTPIGEGFFFLTEEIFGHLHQQLDDFFFNKRDI